MALWGKTDTLASTPKFVARTALFNSASASVVNATTDTINLLASNTGFSTGDAVLYSIAGGTVIGGLTNATTYYVRVVDAGTIELYTTYAQSIAAPAVTGRVNITGLGVGVQSLQRTPLIPNTFADHEYNGSTIVFVDSAEASSTASRAKGIKNAGWWAYRTWTNADGSVAQRAECLVALTSSDTTLAPATTGDQADDAIAVDLAITISTQPANASVTNPAAATFTIVATANTAMALNYQWQKAESTATTTWTNVTGATSASYTTGATAVAAGPGATNGDLYRCIVSVASISVTSNSATLTVA